MSMTNGQDEKARSTSEALTNPIRAFDYEYLTDGHVAKWADEGREQMKSHLIRLCQAGDDNALNVFMQELVESATTGRLDTEDAGLLVKECIASTQSEDPADRGMLQEALLSAVAVLFADEESGSKDNSPIPYISELALFLHASDISSEVLRLEFDSKLTEQLGLVRNTFYRQMVRKQTNLLYRQSNYNLLREESEGFSKLVTELFTTSGNEAPHSSVVEATVEKVKAMIGAFDLDVGRSLDVVLDVFGSVLVKQYRFFVKFLRASPWWPRPENEEPTGDSPLRIGGLPQWALPGSTDWQLSEEQKADFARLSEQRDVEFWTLARKEGLKAFFRLSNNQAASGPDELVDTPRAGSYEAAQLLGFKLRFYAPGAEGDGAEGTPKNLIYLAALLIKIGFISLHDLYPHLWRPDEEMEAYKAHKQAEKDAQEAASLPGAGAQNALAMAGALSDDAVPAPSRVKDQGTGSNTPARDGPSEKPAAKDSTLDKPDQKVSLLLSLLAIGALPEALFILGRFPWMAILIPELPEHIIRIMHHSLDGVYEQSRPLQQRLSLTQQQPVLEIETTGTQKGQTVLEIAPPRKVLRWPLLDRDDSETDGISYRFYWDEWNDNIPVCRSVDDVFTLTQTLLPLVGAKIGHDPSLVLKIVRIGKASLQADDTTHNRNRWLELVKSLLLPSLSVTKANPGLANELFELISLYSTHTRYLMYAHWTGLEKKSDKSDAGLAVKQSQKETSDVLKKISKTNLKPMARALAKIAYSNPHVVAAHALSQIQHYDALADCFVEGARYFTDLGYDVLSWALVQAMSNPGPKKKRIQEDGIFVSKWLVAFSRFGGKIYKRYQLMKPGPILQFVSRQIGKGEVADLAMLEQMIVSMAGISPDTSFNETQLLAMGGGPLLQSQTILQLLDQRHASKGTAKRLIKALNDHGLTTKILVSTAQLRQACIFEQGDQPLKAVGNTFDEVTRILGLYIELLKTNLPIDEFQRTIPGIATMMNDFDIPAEVAFWVGRPVIQKQLTDFDKDAHKDTATKEVNGDVDMLDQDASEEDGEANDSEDMGTAAQTPTDNEINGDGDEHMQEAEQTDECWHPVLKTIMDEMQPQLPEEVINLIGVGFYATFWQLSAYDIHVPGKSYEDEMNRQKKKINSITLDRTNISVSGSKVKDSQLKQLKQLVEDLLAENKQHLKAYGENRMRLQKEKEHWFAGKARLSNELSTALMEHCFLPRMLLSASDAYYCFRLVKLLHSLGTPNFRTIGFYDLLFRTERLTSLIFQCTSKESDNLGKFLFEVLREFARWHQNKATFEKEAYGAKKQLPGFAKKVEKGKPHILFDFEDFKKVLFKWHSNLHAALLKCLSSDEYMHVRNAISILRVVSPVWPAVDYHGRQLKNAVDKLRESEREDLKVPSQAISGALHRRQREWVSPSAFRPGPGPEGTQEQANGTTSAQPKEEANESSKQNDLPDQNKIPEVKMNDAPAQVNGEKHDDQPTRDPDRTPSTTSNTDRKTPSRASTPLPSRSVHDTASRRPPRPDSRAHDLPRRVSPPPRFQPPATLPSRPDPEPRAGYRDSRPPRSAPADPPRPDSRSNYSRHTAERNHDHTSEASHRYPRGSDRPSMLDRDERPPRRDDNQRPIYEERRNNERDARPEREPRPDREARPEREFRQEREPRHEREHARPSDRDQPRHGEREYGRSTPDHSDRRRDEANASSRRDAPGGPSRNATPQAQAPSINPERAALIQNSEEARPGMSIRGQAQDRARTSRPPSPRREEERRHAPRNERDDRHERERRPELQSRPSGTLPPSPTSSRTGPPSGPPRDARGPHSRPPVDMSHGRLEQDSSHRPPTRPERSVEAEPPSGPRTRAPNSSLRNTEVAPPTHTPSATRQPPSGPGRHTRNSSFQEPAPSVVPPSSDVSGVHPDRMNHISPVEPPRGQRPPPLQTAPPSGPRNAPPTGPSAPSPNTRGPPSGPQAEGGRGRRHQMTAVNNTLAQAAQGGPPAPTGRGRGGPRQNSISYSGQMPPPSPVGGHNQNFPPQQDLMANNNPNGMPVQPRGPSSRQDGGMRGDEDRRPTRTQSSQSLRDSSRNERNAPSSMNEDSNRREPRGPPRNDEGPPPSNRPRGGYRGSNPNGDDAPPASRKHPRDENSQGQYGGGMSRGGSRVANDAKRSRRGG